MMTIPPAASMHSHHPRRRASPCPVRATVALLLAAMLVSASTTIAPPASAAPASSVKSLTGTWRVVAVKVAASPVQALVPDDPSYMGALLDATPTRLSWRRPHRASSLSFRCGTPQRVGGGITCREGDFGPPGARVTRSGRRLTIGWFDGATLILQQVR